MFDYNQTLFFKLDYNQTEPAFMRRSFVIPKGSSPFGYMERCKEGKNQVMLLSFNWYKYSVVIGFLKKKVEAAVAPDEHWSGKSWPVQSVGREFDYRDAGEPVSRGVDEQGIEKHEGQEIDDLEIGDAEFERGRLFEERIEEAEAERLVRGSARGANLVRPFGKWGTGKKPGRLPGNWGVDAKSKRLLRQWRTATRSKKPLGKCGADVSSERPFAKSGGVSSSERLQENCIKSSMPDKKCEANEDLFQLAAMAKIELSAGIRQCAINNLGKQELLLSLHNLLKLYTALTVRQARAFRFAINNAIEAEVEKYYSIHLSGQDLFNLWQGPGG